MLYYITSVQIPAVNAQSVQIMANATAFNQLLGDGFNLISPKNSKNVMGRPSWWKTITCFFKSGRCKYIEFAIRCLFLEVKDKDFVYTRDILIAYIYAIKGCQVVYEAHQKPSGKASFIINILKKRNAKFVSISKALQSYYIARFSINERSILVAHDGVFIEDYLDNNFVDIKKEFQIQPLQKVLLHTGSLYKGRGAELFESILDKFNDISIVHIGGSQDNIDYWKNKINNNRFFAKSHIPNSELIRYQKSTDYLLYPMTRETKTYWCCSPMKMFEFMASKRPIISTNVGSIKEVLNDTNSFSFEPEDELSIFRAIEECLNNESLCKTKAEAAFNDVLENYTWNRRAESIIVFSGIKASLSSGF